MRYYIRRNGRPANRVALRLAVNVGSIHEDDDQRGLAHFLEHMAFNGTANFKPGELITFLESIGARFGPHVNAYTSFDETVYMLDVPTDRPGYVDRGLLALHDFAAGMLLLPEEIEKERGVVIEEWRGRLGAGSRLTDKQLPVLLARVALRRTAADRHAGGVEVVSAPAPGRLLPPVVSPRSDGAGRRRRHRRGGASEDCRTALRQHPRGDHPARARRSDRAGARGDAGRGGHRSRGAGVDRALAHKRPFEAERTVAIIAARSFSNWRRRC
jgi:hypothetical protein